MVLASGSSRQQRAEWQRAHLIDSALEVFAEKGFDGATVKDLSKAAGVSEGLMYHYFRSKEDLLRVILEQRFFLPELSAIISSDPRRTAREVLTEVVHRFAAVFRKHQLFVRLMVREAPTNAQIAARLAQARREGTRIVSQYLESRVQIGELRPHDSEAVARLLLFAAISPYLISVDEDSEPSFLSSAVEIVLQGISTS